MKKIIMLIFLLISGLILANDYVFSTNGKDNFDRLLNSVWRNKLEKINVKNMRKNWYLIRDGETYRIHSLKNGVFYIDNTHTGMRDYYGYNTKTDELWNIEECDDGWCLGDVPYQRFSK